MAQQQQQQGGGDNAFAPVWILILLFLIVYFIWREAHQYIVGAIFYINTLLAKLINLVLDNNALENDIFFMQTADLASVDFNTMLEYTRHTGDYLRYPVAVILAVLAFFLYRSNITLKFRKTYSMKTLRQQEQYNWTSIMPVVKEDLVKADVDKGPWAMAMTPMEFARKYRLLKKNDATLDANTPGLEMTAGIKRGDAKRIFTLQLGPYWQGIEHCSPHAAAIAAVFMARINRDRDGARYVLDTLNKTFAEGKPNFAVAQPLIKKHYQSADVQQILQKHAYFLTAVASLLVEARKDGVVPSAEFLWLKVVDRRLWYMLNCVGRQTPYAEVGGPFAHWKAENAIGRPTRVPMIDEAIKALEIAVREIKLSPRELQELEP